MKMQLFGAPTLGPFPSLWLDKGVLPMCARRLFALFALFAVFAVLALFASRAVSPVAAAEQGAPTQIPVDVAVFEYPPLYHTAKSGAFSGLIGETLKQICRESRLDCRFHMRPVSRAYLEIEKGEVQALVTVRFERFKACCIESEWSYPWRSGIYAKVPESAIPANLEQLNGDALIVIQGWQSPYTYFQDLDGAEQRGELQIHRANSSESALRMLDRDRAPYLWGGEEFAWHIERFGMQGLYFKPLLEIPMVLWISKETPDIAERFNQGYQKLRSKGWLNERNALVRPLMTERYEEP